MSDTIYALAPTAAANRFPPSEIAALVVNENIFTDWESIWVQHRWNDAFAFFRFTAAERTPPPSDWTLLQFKPGDSCVITLAGEVALTGIITERQTSYDAQRHQVQLVGKSRTHWGYKSSVDVPPGSFDGKTLEQVYMQTMSMYPGTPLVIGIVNAIPFTKLQNEIGELTWDFLDRISRSRGAVLGADNKGNYLLIGDHSYPVTAGLKEGVNIKGCECLISITDLYAEFDSRAQTAGNDQQYGAAANELQCIVSGQSVPYSKLITPMEHPVASKPEVCNHSYNVAKWHGGTQVVANIVTYGWTYNGTDLWAAGQDVQVTTPMAMLDMVMKVRTVTFEQNNQVGTQTTLECVAPWLLDDRGTFNPGQEGVPQAPTPNPAGSPPASTSTTDTPVGP